MATSSLPAPSLAAQLRSRLQGISKQVPSSVVTTAGPSVLSKRKTLRIDACPVAKKAKVNSPTTVAAYLRGGSTTPPELGDGESKTSTENFSLSGTIQSNRSREQDKLLRRPRRSGKFVENLLRMLREREDVISWTEDGLAIRICDMKRIPEVLPSYFDTNKTSSFLRQLNAYGFRRIRGTKTFVREEFRKSMSQEEILKKVTKMSRRNGDVLSLPVQSKPASMSLQSQQVIDSTSKGVDRQTPHMYPSVNVSNGNVNGECTDQRHIPDGVHTNEQLTMCVRNLAMVVEHQQNCMNSMLQELAHLKEALKQSSKPQEVVDDVGKEDWFMGMEFEYLLDA